jgi:acyl-CoA dehydrogenase
MAIYETDHDLAIFRQALQRFLQNEIVPHIDEWESAGITPRWAWRKMGEQGYLCPALDSRYGGAGADFRYSVVISEEMSRVGAVGLMASLHSDIVVPYIESFGSEEQKQKWLPGCARGEIITAVAMTEPDTGSDLAAIKTTARREGDSYLLSGQKTFISNGINADLVIVVAKTDPQAKPASRGISLLCVERDTPGFTRGRNLQKMGLHSQDTAELSFVDCRVPADNLIGQEGKGFYYLMSKLQQERLLACVMAQAMAERMLEMTIAYCRQRRVFGRPVSALQHNTFKIVEMATEIELGRSLLKDLIADHLAGREVVKKVSMAKAWIPEMANRIAYHCVQLHGGYGYMEEYPICRFARDVRVGTIYAGTTEVMKVIIGRLLELDEAAGKKGS